MIKRSLYGEAHSTTRAKLFQNAGNECEVFLRFSIVANEQGSADTVRDPPPARQCVTLDE
jgi:catalase